MENLFVTNNEAVVRESKAAIAFTAELTNTAMAAARDLLSAAVVGGTEETTNRVKTAMTDNDELDRLLVEFTEVDTIDLGFMSAATEDEIDRMLKSQQSKRSRSKKNEMTQDNFIKLATAAAAEMMLRRLGGKAKNQTTQVKLEGCVLTDEMRASFTEDQESLKKAIRNVQSKKTGLKKKGLENGEEWNAMLEFEAELKSLRIGGGRTTTVVREVQVVPEEVANKAALVDDAAAIMAEVENIDKLKANEAKELLKKIQEMMAQ